MTDAPRPVSTTTITDVTSRYIEALEDECLRSTSRLDKNSNPNQWSQKGNWKSRERETGNENLREAAGAETARSSRLLSSREPGTSRSKCCC